MRGVGGAWRNDNVATWRSHTGVSIFPLMRYLHSRHLALFVALVVSAACATASQNSAGKAGKITPPAYLRAGPSPQIREEVDLRIEVLIDADGQPDMRTLKVAGRGSGSARPAIEDWIQSSTFKPAMQNGQPVAAVFKTGLKTRVQVIRR